MESGIFPDVNIEFKYEDVARSFAQKFLMSKFDSSGGITVSVDMPFGGSGLMNISRPEVLRTYYGMNYRYISPNILERYSYGCTLTNGTLSMDPRKYVTKAMSPEMHDFGHVLQHILLENYHGNDFTNKLLKKDLNHCTILIYSTHINNVNSKLSYHRDSKYSHHGKFRPSANSQGIDTPVIVYSLGDPRDICFRRRYVSGNKKSVWEPETNHF